MLITKLEGLEVYTISLQLTKEVKGLVYKIPHYWTIPESDQILRSSSSIPSNIAEGFANRFYIRKLYLYLNHALGSSDETQNHLRSLRGGNYISDQDTEEYLVRYKSLSVKILNWMNYLRKNYPTLF